MRDLPEGIEAVEPTESAYEVLDIMQTLSDLECSRSQSSTDDGDA